MRVKFSILLTALLLHFATAFAQPSVITRYLPDQTSMVMSFNPVKLANKVPGETFRQSAMYRELMKKDDGELKAFMSDPSISGIDFSTDLVFAIQSDTAAGNPSPSICIFGVLKNEALFSLMVNKMSKGEENPVQVFGNNRMKLSPNANSAIAWNDEIFVVSSSMGNRVEGITELYADTTDTRDFEVKFQEYTAKLLKEQRKLCFELLTPKPNNKFSTNARFIEAMAATGDIKMWDNGSNMRGGKQLKKMPPEITALLSKLQSFSGTSRASVINFENGKISGTTRSYLSDDVAALHQKYPASPLNTDLIRRLPKEGMLLGLMTTSMNPGMAKEMMEKTGLNFLKDSIQQMVPFDLNLLSGAFKSEMMLAVMNMPVKNSPPAEDEEPRSKMFDGLQIILAMPIASKEKFTELKNAIIPLLDSMKGKESNERLMKGLNPSIKYNDNLLVFSLSENVSNDFLQSPATSELPAWMKDMTSYPMVMNLNMRELISMVLSKGGKREASSPEEQKMLGIMDQMIITGGNYENGTMNSKMEFRFGNPNENAMKQLFDMMNMMIEQAEQKRQSYMEEKEEVNISPDDKDAPKVMRDEEVELPPPPPPPPPAPAKKKTTTPVKKTKG